MKQIFLFCLLFFCSISFGQIVTQRTNAADQTTEFYVRNSPSNQIGNSRVVIIWKDSTKSTFDFDSIAFPQLALRTDGTPYRSLGIDAEGNVLASIPSGGSGSTVTIGKGFMEDTLAVNGVKTIIPRYNFFDDFLGSNNTDAGSAFFQELASGASANAGRATDQPAWGSGYGYGILQTGTTSTGKAVFQETALINRNIWRLVIDTNYYVRMSIKGFSIQNESNATDSFQVTLGFSQDNADQHSEVFQYIHGVNSGNWIIKTGLISGSPTTTNTSVPVTDSTEYDLAIELYNGRVKYWINGVLEADHAFPLAFNSSRTFAPILRIQKFAGVNNRNAYIDAVKIRIVHENDL